MCCFRTVGSQPQIHHSPDPPIEFSRFPWSSYRRTVDLHSHSQPSSEPAQSLDRLESEAAAGKFLQADLVVCHLSTFTQTTFAPSRAREGRYRATSEFKTFQKFYVRAK
eukprot:COSAG01_NODE_5207_length_4408_cov_44.080065_1_plen_109_part_00